MKINPWGKIIIGAIFEVGWVIGLKHSTNAFEYLITAIAIFGSFYFLINASKELPVGTAYSVFVGLGTFGSTLSEIFIFGQPVVPLKILFTATLLLGVIGLKIEEDMRKRKEIDE
nr:multidrug efflux SMR transporter [Clostridioides sp.]